MCQTIEHNPPHVDRTEVIEGTMQIKDGVLLYSMTNDSNKNVPRPKTFHAPILRMDGRELVLLYSNYYQTKAMVYRKVGP
jgi:hypothetical protein